jgi:hypothetical protein
MGDGEKPEKPLSDQAQPKSRLPSKSSRKAEETGAAASVGRGREASGAGGEVGEREVSTGRTVDSGMIDAVG